MRSSVVTSVAAVVLAGSGAVAGVLLSHRFGRNARTDGLLAAYGVYLVLTLAAQAFRIVVTPELTRAAAEERLGVEVRAYFAALLLVAVPATVVVALLHATLGRAVTGGLPDPAAATAGSALVWLVPAGFAQLVGALGASALATRDSYAIAALGFAGGGVAGLAVFAALESHGVLSLVWGLAVNGAVAALVPLAALLRGGELRGGGRAPLVPHRRLWRVAQGAAAPIAVQGCYVIGLRVAAGLGVGRVTTLSYAYILAAMLVTATAFTLGVVSSAPLTRRGLTPEAGADHVVHSVWVSLALVGAAAGVFALVGGPVGELALGHAFAGDVGAELGKLVVELAPFMVAWAAFSVVFPLVFVTERRRVLVPLALVTLALFVPVSVGLRDAFGLAGIAFALALAVGGMAAVLLLELSPRMLVLTLRRLAVVAAAVAVAAALAFGAPALVVGPVAAAAIGLALYAALVVGALRPLGLAAAFTYVRGLH